MFLPIPGKKIGCDAINRAAAALAREVTKNLVKCHRIHFGLHPCHPYHPSHPHPHPPHHPHQSYHHHHRHQVAAEGGALTLGGISQTPSYLAGKGKQAVQAMMMMVDDGDDDGDQDYDGDGDAGYDGDDNHEDDYDKPPPRAKRLCSMHA